jgi:hypothetical protein
MLTVITGMTALPAPVAERPVALLACMTRESADGLAPSPRLCDRGGDDSISGGSDMVLIGCSRDRRF